MSSQENFGHLAPRYSFLLNPHKDLRLARCPKCNELTRLRKFVLLICVDQFGILNLGKTCRFCVPCNLVMVHQDELESLMANIFEERKPEVIGNEYFVAGTTERKVWRKGMNRQSTLEEVLRGTADFKEKLDLKYEPGGWYPSAGD